MVNVIIDSCTYGNIIKDKKDGEKVAEGIIKDEQFIVCNFKVIRDELRNAPKQVLTIYDQIVSSNIIQDSKEISGLAEEYYKEYRKNGGGKGKTNIIKDFKIVACASIKNCDLVFSDDNSTMKCKNALNSYKTINLKFNHRTPTFYSYSDLKKRYLTN
jgi:hypothetical protein